ncbi:hypothetical protein [Persicobacter diffluens]|uniref:Outer membrane protein beta-barrel domain-containing protein n=1 Tax=Persicobacter diffluens TaxID=981 RepID=A0AAN4W0S0_9BACT|nr:hypothetical protein PEDI_33460 [Persicobacter diffluens]
MKRPYLLAFLLLFSLQVMGQKDQDIQELKFEPGDWAIEFNFKSFLGNNLNVIEDSPEILSPSMGVGLRVRKFLGEKGGVRMEGNYGRVADNYKYEALYSGPTYDSKTTGAVGGISLGYEYHFVKNDRFTAYIGGQFFYNQTKSTFKEGGKISPSRPMEGTDDKIFVRQSGVDAFLGLDYYLSKKFYVGLESRFRWGRQWDKMILSEEEGNPPVDAKEKDYYTIFGFVSPELRVGFLF